MGFNLAVYDELRVEFCRQTQPPKGTRPPRNVGVNSYWKSVRMILELWRVLVSRVYIGKFRRSLDRLLFEPNLAQQKKRGPREECTMVIEVPSPICWGVAGWNLSQVTTSQILKKFISIRSTTTLAHMGNSSCSCARQACAFSKFWTGTICTNCHWLHRTTSTSS